jgi:hypothetical protein
VDHPIWAEQGVLPSLWGDETGIAEQGDSTDKKIVQVLDGHVNGACVVHLYSNGLLVGVNVAAEGGQKVADAAFGREIAVEKAKALRIVRVAWVLQVA